METISIVLILMIAVIVSGVISRMLPLPVPLPLVQIAFGAVIASVANLGVMLDPDVFFLLFIPPLLFLDGWRIPKEGLLRDKGTIIELALGLVVFTVVGLGFLINWMIPSMPLAVAFALAPIVSPTDPVAVSAIAARVAIPKRLMHILEGESLLNDASGLVCMRFAVIAALTGAFSLVEASLTFLWLVAGGIVVGAGVTWSVSRLKNWISWKLGEDTGSQILISLVIPFVAYLVAEHLHASGILAAVAAGLVMSYAEQTGQALATTRIRRTGVWDTAQFALNGAMFVLLGEQLPRIAAGAAEVVRQTGHHEPAWLVVYVFVINIALSALRFMWVWISLRFTMYRATRRGQNPERPSWRLVAATSLAGVRGAITLAGILTLPLVLADGSPFPARDLAIFLAAGVIIFSLIGASIALPILLNGLKLPPETYDQRAEDRARVAAAEAAIRATENAQSSLRESSADAELYASSAAHLMDIYRQRISVYSTGGTDELEDRRRAQGVDDQLWMNALRAERDAIYREARARRLSDEIARKLVREIDLNEARLGIS
ncbi:Na+/H+ antiporter [Ancylobacter sp. VNQ12]|uniref:Na+/H+ antiporter n=1 Tax=Ancylobacter sp. VNQ12 TaxID=3400920 RepID=UPI003BFAF37A